MIVSRFAPAPTGHLHLGHVVNALHVWGITRALGGRVLLRIEDHDRQRSRDTFERAILDDLDWLGFVPDDPPTDAFRAGVCRGRQRDRQDVYAQALARLADRVYACDCTRREVRAAMEAARGPLDPEAELWYSGRCATRGLEWRPGMGLRVRVEATVERFVDLRHGLQEQRPSEQCGDILLKDRDGNWTYQLGVVADDLAQGVSLVIRGDDLLASTGRQILLARLLGRGDPPRFLHHGLLMKSAAQKLSKADRDTSVRDLRAAGATPERLFGRALHAAGFAVHDRPLTRCEAEAMVAAQYAAALAQFSGSHGTIASPMTITVETTVHAPIDDVWRAYTTPEAIVQWNAASDDWHTTTATVDLRVGGAFSSRMEAKDGSFGFDFAGTYTSVVPNRLLEYAFGDRTAKVEFLETPAGVVVRVTFEAETTYPVEQQQTGWQAILENFKRYVESHPS